MATVNVRRPFNAYKGTKPYAFVSYAHQNADVVYPLLNALHKEKYRIWYDEGIYPGNEWPDEIAQALINSTLFLVFLTGNAVKSRNVKSEINYALRRSKPILPVYLEETRLPDGLDLRIGSLQAIMKCRISDEEYQETLVRSLARWGLDDTVAAQLAAIRKAIDANESATLIEARLEDLYARFPDDSRMLCCLGQFHNRRLDYQSAVRAFSRGLLRSPDDAVLHWELALVLRGQGRVSEARGHLERVVALGDPPLRRSAEQILQLPERGEAMMDTVVLPTDGAVPASADRHSSAGGAGKSTT